MSKKELDRYQIIQNVLSKQLTQKKAGQLLELSDRQIRNVIHSLKKHGPQGIISKKRNKPSNRKSDQGFRNQIMSIVHRQYSDFGPTFAQEKLFKCHELKISNETLRKWMIEDRLWVPKKHHRNIHPSRERRESFGDLIQIDGSPDFWFEDRADKCNLTVFIDDATSKITSLFFSPTESLAAYFQ